MRPFLQSLIVSLGTAGEVLMFLWRRKRWWLIPLVTVLLVFGLLLAVASASGLSVFIYTLF